MEYEVEAILNHRSKVSPKGRKLQYLIKWKDYDLEESTWEFEDDVMADELLKKYWDARGGEEARERARMLDGRTRRWQLMRELKGPLKPQQRTRDSGASKPEKPKKGAKKKTSSQQRKGAPKYEERKEKGSPQQKKKESGPSKPKESEKRTASQQSQVSGASKRGKAKTASVSEQKQSAKKRKQDEKPTESKAKKPKIDAASTRRKKEPKRIRGVGSKTQAASSSAAAHPTLPSPDNRATEATTTIAASSNRSVISLSSDDDDSLIETIKRAETPPAFRLNDEDYDPLSSMSFSINLSGSESTRTLSPFLSRSASPWHMDHIFDPESDIVYDLDYRADLSWDWKTRVRSVEAVTKACSTLFGVVRWDDDVLAMYPTDLIGRRCPEQLLQYYESKLNWELVIPSANA